jgi:hypothetical protein
MPSWVKKLPKEVQEIFSLALGNVFKVHDFDRYGDLVLQLTNTPSGKFLDEYHEIIVGARYVDSP